MILETICIILIVITMAIIVNTIEEVRKRNKSKISFREAMDLSGLPVITFYNNGKKVNFLLDTGSNVSYINETTLKGLKYQLSDEETNMIGIEGSKSVVKICSMDVYYKNIIFNEEFNIADLGKAFDLVKKESGVTINGILGSAFFQRFKYILDYNEMVFYTKR